MRAVTPESQDQILRDRALVERLLAGDEEAFEQLSEDHFGRLYRFALSRLGQDEHLAGEVVQATLVSAFETLDAYRAEAPLFSWLCGICRFKIGAHFRSLRRRPVEVGLSAGGGVMAVLDSLACGGDSPEEGLRRKEVARLVHQALDHLPRRYGRALEWKYLEGLPVQEIAERLEVGPKAAESVLSRARPAFRAAFEKLCKNLDGGYQGLRLAT